MRVDSSLIHRLFYPQVPLVMAAQHRGRVSAMPVVSYLSVSEKPPMVGVGCMPTGFTCTLALKARAFSLSVLDRSQSDAMAKLASASGAKIKDKLSEAGLPHSIGRRWKVPVLKDALATIECRLAATPRFGDHLVLVGEVVAARASDAFSNSWDFNRYRPMLYTGWRDGLTFYGSP
ncbi:MAG: flavin reductase family protein [Thaumarchaeota archaeon]|nr:flavin reductase family protein [Nitrososphaerota archaeon]